jgi:hypothetical protein
VFLYLESLPICIFLLWDTGMPGTRKLSENWDGSEIGPDVTEIVGNQGGVELWE